MFNFKKSSKNKRKINFKQGQSVEAPLISQADSQQAGSSHGGFSHDFVKTAPDVIRAEAVDLEQAAEKLRTGDKPEKVDIERYKDPEGLTVKKMELGLWAMEHRRQLMMVFAVLLVLISAISWTFFIYHFGYYFGWGMKEDQKLVNELAQSSLIGHDFFVQSSPQGLQYGEAQIIKLDEKKYDLLARVRNPNEKFAIELEYYFLVSGKEIGRTSGFILPNETKYLLSLVQNLASQPAGIELYLDNLKWLRINRHKIFPWEDFKNEHLDIKVDDIQFTPAKATILTEKLSLNDLQFTAINNTVYNYWEVSFIILLLRQNQVVGVNKYVLDNFMSDQVREVKITWPGNFGRVDNIVITPEINILRDDIYIQFEGGTGEEK